MTIPTHHRPEGGFRNPWRSAKQHGFLDFMKWVLIDRRRNPRRPDPDPAVFRRVYPGFVYPRADPNTFTITWIGHTSFLIQQAGLNVLLDPVWSERASPVSFAGPRRWVPPGVDFDALPPIDCVVLSHDHYDHLDSPTIAALASRYPAIEWFAPLEVGHFLTSHGARSVHEVDWWNSEVVGNLHITAVPAQHFSGRRLGNRNRTLWCGWILRCAGNCVFFAGDTALHPEFSTIAERCGPFDLAILPIGAYEPRWFMGSVHMNPEDCLEAFTQLQRVQAPRRLVMTAAHWGTFKLTDEPMDEPPIRMRELWNSAGIDARDLWILQHGETRTLD